MVSRGALWLEDKGIPARRFFSLAASHGLGEQVARLEKEAVPSLQAQCQKRGLPFAALRDRDELVACLTAVLVWERLPVVELQRELRQWGTRTGASVAEGDDPDELSRRLISFLWGAVREARGLPTARLGASVADAVFREVLRLEALSSEAVEAEYGRELEKLSLPAEEGAGRQYHLDCLTRILVLEELPMAELKKECLEYGEPARNGMQRYDLARCLFVCAMCREPWEARGIPVRRLGPLLALKIVERHQHLDGLSEEELEAEHDALGFLPKIAGLRSRRDELLSRLKAVSLWQELPLEALQEECGRLGFEGQGEPSSDRRQLLQQLAVSSCLAPWEAAHWEEQGIPVRRIGRADEAGAAIGRVAQLEAMDEAALRAEYTALGLPPEAGQAPKGRTELLERLRQAACWRALPLNELRRECQELKVSSGGLGGSMDEKEKCLELAERLMIASWADAWVKRGDVPLWRLGGIRAVASAMQEVVRLEALDMEMLGQEYGKIGLPQSALTVPKTREELLKRLKRVVFWRSTRIDELREECLQLSVSFRTDGARTGEQQKAELVERLVMALCADAWEARGIPVKRLSGIEAADALARRWGELEQMGSKDLQEAYGKLGLPREAEAPKVLELLPRLKQAAVWESLPVTELQKECRKLGAPSSADHEEAVRTLITSSWGVVEDAKDGPTGGPSPLPANAKELLRETAKHFETMGLGASANMDDLKKAYRQACLLHHPDKNPNKPQEEAKKKFQEITEAYEELCSFMRQKK